MPESERGSAFKRHDEMSMKTNARVNEDAKSDSRDEASAGLPSVFANQPSAPETGAASFESSVVMTPRPAPDQVPSPSQAEQRTPSDTDASAHPLLATILFAVLLVVGWALARAMFDRRVAG